MNRFQWIFLKLFPDLRIEVGCVFSLVAVYLMVDQNAPLQVITQLSTWFAQRDLGPLSLALFMLLLGLAGLVYPFFRLSAPGITSPRLGALHMAVSVLVLLSILGTIAAKSLMGVCTSPSGPWLGVGVAGAAFLEFGFLVIGGVNLLDHPALLRHLLGPPRADWQMFSTFVVFALVLIALQQFTLWMSAFDCAMVIVQVVWVLSCLSRKKRHADSDAPEECAP